MRLSRSYSFLIVLPIFSVIVACQDKNTEAKAPEPVTKEVQIQEQIQNEIQSPVLAKVNGEAITEYELIRESDRLLGEENIADLDTEIKDKLLQSLVARRAMAQIMNTQLSDEERLAIEEDSSAYREKLMMKAYLTSFAKPEPVTDEMVQSYYNSHPELYGGATVRRYELVSALNKLKGPIQTDLVKAVGGLASSQKWPEAVSEINTGTDQVSYQQGGIDEKLLHPDLTRLMLSLEVGDSKFILTEGRPNVVRLLGVDQKEPLPLSRVGSKIRRQLLSVRIRDAIKVATEKVMDESEIEILVAPSELTAN